MQIDKKNILKSLNSQPYFHIISNFYKNQESKKFKKETLNFARLFGKIRFQDKKKNNILEIKANTKKINNLKKNKKKIKTVLRYHQTNLGGSIHSDGPQLNIPPKYLIMSCQNNSENGGDSIITNAKKIYEYLKKKDRKNFKELTNKFYFERRGYNFSKQNIFKKPIFYKKGKKFIFRYLRDYINKAYYLKKIILSKKQQNALNNLDKLLKDKKFAIKFKLNKGDLIILNNHVLAHGRTAFKIAKKNNTIRKLYRVWAN